jgi:hypothetical protein
MSAIKPILEEETTAPKVTGLTKVDRVKRWLTLASVIFPVVRSILFFFKPYNLE